MSHSLTLSSFHYHHSSFVPLSNLQFSEKFQEVKEAAKLARDKSQDKVDTLSNHSEVNEISLLSVHVLSSSQPSLGSKERNLLH